LHWFWLDLVLANSGTKIGWTLHFDFVSGSSRRDRDAIYLSHRADDVTWRVVLTGDGKIRDGKVVVASRENFSAPQQGIRGQPMEAVTDLERAVLLRFLEGDDPVLRALRDQLAVAEVREREFTGVGFFTYFLRHPGIHPVSLPDGVLNPPLVGDVELQAENLRYGVGFVLFVKDGLLHFLEGYTKGGEPWPDDLGRYVVRRDAVPES
jgi:hypothetical protein